jgi:hypothetical protein
VTLARAAFCLAVGLVIGLAAVLLLMAAGVR